MSIAGSARRAPPAAVLAGSDVALFASDMHLGDHDRDTAALFGASLLRLAVHATHVFLLGDLFEAWIGDDQPDAVAHAARARLAGLVAGGVRLFVMRGNRDFLLDVGPHRFSAATGAVMLEDPAQVVLFGERVVLTHGDALCLDDLDYQRLRDTVRDPAWQAGFLARPLADRLAFARALRGESERAKAARGPDDVTQAAVDAALDAADARLMIHGHTHRPACHRWVLDGRPARRWVLPDWDAAGGRGGFLRVDAGQIVVLDADGVARERQALRERR